MVLAQDLAKAENADLAAHEHPRHGMLIELAGDALEVRGRVPQSRDAGVQDADLAVEIAVAVEPQGYRTWSARL